MTSESYRPAGDQPWTAHYPWTSHYSEGHVGHAHTLLPETEEFGKNAAAMRQTPLSYVLYSVPPALKSQAPLELAIRRAKVVILRAKRIASWARSPHEFPRAKLASQRDRVLLHEVLVDATGTQSHPILEQGKLRNLQVAAAHFDGRLLTPDSAFSFWRLLGNPTRARGFLPGTEVRDGCIVPTVGGGLCMLSGALFRLAAEMDWVIHERHGHTVAPSNPSRIDATVFWPFVDLRFAPRTSTAVLRVQMRDGTLRVAAYGEPAHIKPRLRVWREPVPSQTPGVHESLVYRGDVSNPGTSEKLGQDLQQPLPQGLTRNCLTCKEHQCHARQSLLETL